MNQILIKNKFTLNPHKTAVTQLLPWWGIIVKVSSGWRIYTQGHMVLGKQFINFPNAFKSITSILQSDLRPMTFRII